MNCERGFQVTTAIHEGLTLIFMPKGCYDLAKHVPLCIGEESLSPETQPGHLEVGSQSYMRNLCAR